MIANKRKAYNRLFSKIHIVIPPSSLSSLNVKAIKQHKRVYPELSVEVLEKIDDETQELNEKGKDHHSLIIFDDVGAQIKSDHTLQETLKQFSWNYRHQARSMWFLLQSYRSLTLGVRKVATHLYVWKLSQLELETIAQELILWLTKVQFLDACRHVFGHGKHTCMFIDLDQQAIWRLTDNNYFRLSIQ
eukprot:g3715.t1